MAGRGQHAIPQHFLKPFVTPSGGDRIWLYRRGHNQPYAVPRHDIAKQRDFYSTPSGGQSTTLDDHITNYEKTIFKRVNELRDMPNGSSPPPAIVCEVAAHLSARSAHTRSFMRATIEGFSNSLGTFTEDPAPLLQMQRLPANNPPGRIQASLLDTAARCNLEEMSGIRADTLARVLYLILREKRASVITAARQLLPSLLGELTQKSKTIASDAHVNALTQSLAPDTLIQRLSGLNWRVVPKEGTSAILPDCVCIARTSYGWQMLLPLFSTDLELVVFPITPDNLIVGYTHEFSPSAMADYNRFAASVCMDFFVARDKCPEFDDLHMELGNPLRLKVSHLIGESVREAIKEKDTELPVSAPDPRPEATETVSSTLQFQLVLRGFGDELLGNNLGHQISDLVRRMMPVDSFRRIDGFTFAVDYEAVLAGIGRGFESEQIVQTTSSEQAIGMAMPITVRRQDGIKTHVVLRNYVAELLLSESDLGRKFAQQVVTNMLASIYLQDLVCKKFPNIILTNVEDAIEGYLFQASGTIFDVYFCSRSTIDDLTSFTEHREALIADIEEARVQIVQRRRDYRIQGDLGALMDYAIATLQHVLNSAARVLGAQHGLDSQFTLSIKLVTLLKEMGMFEWFKLFAEDLDAFYCGLDDWSEFESLFFTNRHLERWLLSFGIIVEEADNGQVYAHVPLDSDAEYLLSLTARTKQSP